MPLSQSDAAAIARSILSRFRSERACLDRIDRYLRGDHDGPYMPKTATTEYKLLAERLRTNLLPQVVNGVLHRGVPAVGFQRSGAGVALVAGQRPGTLGGPRFTGPRSATARRTSRRRPASTTSARRCRASAVSRRGGHDQGPASSSRPTDLTHEQRWQGYCTYAVGNGVMSSRSLPAWPARPDRI